MERLGASKSVVGLVIPTGYSFNLDGTNIYMTLATLFLAQATNTPLTFGQELGILVIAMITSKGASGVTGAGFVTLAATLAIVPDIPIQSLAILVGIDKFMSECRALTNLVGNGVATVVISRWEGELDAEKLHEAMAHPVDARRGDGSGKRPDLPIAEEKMPAQGAGMLLAGLSARIILAIHAVSAITVHAQAGCALFRARRARRRPASVEQRARRIGVSAARPERHALPQPSRRMSRRGSVLHVVHSVVGSAREAAGHRCRSDTAVMPARR